VGRGRLGTIREAFGADVPLKSAAKVSQPLADAVKSMRTESAPSPARVTSPLQSITGAGASNPAWPSLVTVAYVEVLDPPSMPEAPRFPKRTSIVGLGLIAGLLLGLMAALLRPVARPATA